MTCPNTDPSFGLLRSLLGRAPLPAERAAAFWGVCVPVRATLYALVTYFSGHWAVRTAVALAGAVTAVRLLSMPLSGPWWWSKPFQAAAGAAVAVGALMGWAGYPIVLWASLVGGIIHALASGFC